MISPNNQSTTQNPVGRFMVAVGAVIENPLDQTILLMRRAGSQDWQNNEWEITYGRIDQFEDTYQGLAREVREEAGLTNIRVKDILTTWHIFRGEKSAENEVIGITYVCETDSTNVTPSFEHSEFRWVKPEEALQLVKVDGIRRDILAFIEYKKGSPHR